MLVTTPHLSLKPALSFSLTQTSMLFSPQPYLSVPCLLLFLNEVAEVSGLRVDSVIFEDLILSVTPPCVTALFLTNQLSQNKTARVCCVI